MKRVVVAIMVMGLFAVERTASAANACVNAADKGQDLRAAGKLDEARAMFLACAKPTCNRVVRADCERWIKEIDEELATPAPPPPPPAPAPPPVVEEKPLSSVHVVTVKETHPLAMRPTPVSAIILGGASAVSLIAFGWFQLQGWSGHAALEQGCARTQRCTDADIDPVRSQFVASGVALGISVVSLGAAAIIYFTRGTTTSSRVGIAAGAAAISF